MVLLEQQPPTTNEIASYSVYYKWTVNIKIKVIEILEFSRFSQQNFLCIAPFHCLFTTIDFMKNFVVFDDIINGHQSLVPWYNNKVWSILWRE